MSAENIRIKGFIFSCDEDNVYLCSELLDSFPPQRGKSSLVVKGLNFNDLKHLRRYEGCVWSERPVVVCGKMTNGFLEVSFVADE